MYALAALTANNPRLMREGASRRRRGDRGDARGPTPKLWQIQKSCGGAPHRLPNGCDGPLVLLLVLVIRNRCSTYDDEHEREHEKTDAHTE
ncbi:MAG: hypothetical protein FJY92_06115 [Candidatus Hydrogenedentes bacterium]|nr:hypothetical protein [Candidatus Hydrogenedentota bacterium]